METIKEEKKTDLEQILNSLIEKGWKPFGTDNRVFKVLRTKNNWWYFDGGFGNEICFSLREIVSKESGLWQFVCENKMEKKMEKNHRGIWINSWAKSAYQSYPIYTMERYEYRIIESSLKDESGLEDFLLRNIKIEGQ